MPVSRNTSDWICSCNATISVHHPPSSFKKKFACNSETLAVQSRNPFNQTPSISAPADFQGGFLKYEPHVFHFGCRSCRNVAISARVTSGFRPSEKLADRRKISLFPLNFVVLYPKWNDSAGIRSIIPVRTLRKSPDTSMSEVSIPKQPALPIHAPPIVPGKPDQGTNV